MIDHRVHRNARYQLRKSANVVGMIVRDQNVIYSGEASTFGDGHDAVCVAALVVRPTSVDQQGFTIGSDEERGLAPPPRRRNRRAAASHHPLPWLRSPRSRHKV